MSKAVAKKKDANEIIDIEDVDVNSMFDDAADLNSHMGQDDLAMPFLGVIQSNSPELDEGDARYIEGAKAGMFVSKIDRKIFDGKKGINLISCAHERRWVEWKTRENGGGRISDYPAEHPIQQEITWTDIPGGGTKPMLPNGNLLIETAYHYVLYQSGGDWEFGIFPLKGTMLKKSKAMNSMIQKEKAVDPRDGRTKSLPRWIRQWNVRTIREEKDGNSWFNVEFERGDRIGSAGLYRLGSEIAGQAKESAYEEQLSKEVLDEVEINPRPAPQDQGPTENPAPVIDAETGEFIEPDVPFN